MLLSRGQATRLLYTSSSSWQKGYNNHHENQRSNFGLRASLAVGAVATVGGLYLHNKKRLLAESAIKDDIIEAAGAAKRGLPLYRKSEVSVHDSDTKRIWVTYKNGVYDITDFVSKHPGAKNILMAAGGSLEPFWNLYAVHQNNAQVTHLVQIIS